MPSIVSPGWDSLDTFGSMLFGSLFFFVLYLLVPIGVRHRRFGAAKRRFPIKQSHSVVQLQQLYGDGGDAISTIGTQFDDCDEEIVFFNNQSGIDPNPNPNAHPLHAPTFSDSISHVSHGTTTVLQESEALMSVILNKLRTSGVVLTAHGMKGKARVVRLKLESDRVTWRTETKNKLKKKELKTHHVFLADCIAVDAGKRTAPLRRPEAAHISADLCFSVLTKNGSLDLQAESVAEADNLVRSFSLILDELCHKSGGESFDPFVGMVGVEREESLIDFR